MYKKNKIDLHATFMHPLIKELIPTKIYFPRHIQVSSQTLY